MSKDKEMENQTSMKLFKGEEQEKTKADKSSSTVKRVSIAGMFRYAGCGELLLVCFGALFAMSTGGIVVATTILLGDTFDVILLDDSTNALNEITLKFVYLGIGSFVSGSLQVLFFTMASERITIRLREMYLKSILSQEIEFFDLRNSADLTSSVAANSIIYREAIGDKLALTIQFIAMFVGGIVIGFTYIWDLALVVLCIIPVVIVIGGTMARFTAGKQERQTTAYAQAGAIADEAIGSIRTVASLNMEKHMISKYASKLRLAEALGIRNSRIGGVGYGLLFFCIFSSYAIGLYYGALVIARDRTRATTDYPPPNGTLLSIPPFCAVGNDIPQICASQSTEGLFFESVEDVCSCPACQCGCYSPLMASAGWDCATGGAVFTTFIAILMGSMGISQAAPGIAAFQNGRIAAAAIYEILERTPAMGNGIFEKKDVKKSAIKDSTKRKDRNVLQNDVQGRLALENVDFTYPSRPDTLILKNLSLVLEAGTSNAFVGESGSGKSTIVNLLLRFYDPSGNGKVTLDGVDITTLDPVWFRSLFGYVGQEPTLFAMTIRENILFGSFENNVSEADLIEAAKAANALDFIKSFPQGFDTLVGGSGSQLSGGQKQRLAIARALIRKPKILLLDEATSALDNVSESVVQKSVEKLSTEKHLTSIYIAHRLSTVRYVNNIVVLGRGNILEKGTHEQLVAKKGHYYAMLNVANHRKAKVDAQAEVSATTSPNEEKENEEDVTVSLEAQTVMNAAAAGGDVVSTVVEAIKPEVQEDIEQQQQQQTKPKKVSFSRIYNLFSKGMWAYYIPGIFSSIASGIVFPIFAIVMSSLITSFFQIRISDLLSDTKFWALMFLAIGGGAGLATFGSSVSFGAIGAKTTSRVRAVTFEAIIRKDIGYFDLPQNSVGAITTTLATDAALVKAAVVDRMSVTIQNISTIVAGLTIAMVASWEVGVVILAVFPVMAISVKTQASVSRGFNNQDKNAIAEAGTVLAESIAGVRTVTALGIKDRVVNLYSSKLEGPKKIALKKGITAGIAYGMGQLIPFLVRALAFWYGGTLVINGTVTFQEYTQSFLAIMMMAVAIGQTAASNTDLIKAAPAVASIFKILDSPSKIDPLSEQGDSSKSDIGAIELKDVNFSYPARLDVQVLTNFSLKIEPGETVAFVGASGSGKSTIVGLLERFYDPQSGVITIDGKNIQSYNISDLRSRFAIVGQEPKLFIGSIKENVLNGRPGATDDDVRRALASANALSFVERFPEKWDAQVGALGGKLSGGQKQRIAIARAIIRNPSVLLLDEATSALDGESEEVVQNALDELVKDRKRTTIVVAHRLSTIRNADKIVVLDKGHIVEIGTYDSLMMKSNGAFKNLYAAQSKS